MRSFARSRHLSLVCLDFAFHLLSSVISVSWPHLYPAFLHVCPDHINLFSLREFCNRVHVCQSFQMSTFLTLSSLVFPLAHRSMRISFVCGFYVICKTSQVLMHFNQLKLDFDCILQPKNDLDELLSALDKENERLLHSAKNRRSTDLVSGITSCSAAGCVTQSRCTGLESPSQPFQFHSVHDVSAQLAKQMSTSL